MEDAPAPGLGDLTTWAELCKLYDGFIFDQFGVLHNGATALPGAADLIERLHSKGKQLVILSNSSKRQQWAIDELPRFDLDPSHFLGVLTSGEAAWQALHDKWHGCKCVWVAKEDGKGVTDYLDGTDLTLAPVETADMILCTGTSTIRDGSSLQHIDTEVTGDVSHFDCIFRSAVDRGIPLLCTNPDFISPPKTKDAKATFQPGHIAKRYEEFGGTVIYFGKPHKEHFAACLRLFGSDVTRIAHVGDSMHHDVQGACAASVPVVFVAGGIEHQHLGIVPGHTPSKESLKDLFLKFDVCPTHTVQLAQWSE